MKRRDFLASLAASAALWPCSAHTESRRVLVGYLTSGSKRAIEPYYRSFPLAMRELGYVEGSDYVVEQRYADGDSSRLPALAEELIRLKPSLIVTGSTPAAIATKRATSDIPIVGLLLTDPVGLGLVASEARPGGNVTGILIRVEGLPAKQLELALDLLPGPGKVGVLLNSQNPSNLVQRRDVESAAKRLGISLKPVDIHSSNEIEAAFQTLVREDVKVLLVFTDAVLNTRRRQIAAFALSLRLPTVYPERDAVEDGGLISYGISRRETYHRAAYYVDRILKGEKPGDLPIEFPTKLELVINLATAKAIGLTVPPTLLARADEVIE